VFKSLADREEALFSWITERSADKNPDWFWKDGEERGPRKGWESWVLDKWPTKLTFNYWYYLLGNLEGSGRYNSSDRYAHWVNWPTWGEWRYLFTNWKGEWTGFKWAWIRLTEETKGERLICRIKGHPEGEVYYNPGGLEPDHRCKTCGEEIG
jgi:hypothetical protein